MALPTFQGTAAAFANAAGGTVNLPAHQADDILLLWIQTAAQTPGNNPPAGWAEVPGSPISVGPAGAAGSNRLSVFWKRAASSSETVPDIGDSGDHQIARAACIRGCRTTSDPFDTSSAASDGAGGTAVSVPGSTTITDDCLVIVIVTHAVDTATSQFSGSANADLFALTNQGNNSSAVGVGGGFIILSGGKAAKGAYGATTTTIATSSTWCGLTLACASQDAPAASAAVLTVILSEDY
jgi:hypothetical protein